MESYTNILLVAPTEFEIKPLLDKMNQPVYTNSYIKEFYLSQNTNLDVIVTGVGIPATIYKIMRIFSRIKYDIVISVGLAYSFNPIYKEGAIVNVTSEAFADMGYQNNNQFLTFFESNVADPELHPFKNGLLTNPNAEKYSIVRQIPKVSGVTMNTFRLSMDDTENLLKKYSPDIQTIEGAAVSYVCQLEKTPFVEIRAIFNNAINTEAKKEEAMPCIQNLNKFVLELLKEININ